jgi:hypothetical protein
MIKQRLIEIINHRTPNRGRYGLLEKQTGISAQVWQHVYHGRTNLDAKHIEAIAKIFPEYAYWITTGQTIPEAGQTSPDLEQLEALQKKVYG